MIKDGGIVFVGQTNWIMPVPSRNNPGVQIGLFIRTEQCPQNARRIASEKWQRAAFDAALGADLIRIDQALRAKLCVCAGFIVAGRRRSPRAHGRTTWVSLAVWIAVFIQRRCFVVVMVPSTAFVSLGLFSSRKRSGLGRNQGIFGKGRIRRQFPLTHCF